MIDNVIFFKLTHYTAFKYGDGGITVSYLLQIVLIQTFTSIFLYYSLFYFWRVSSTSTFFHLYTNHHPSFAVEKCDQTHSTGFCFSRNFLTKFILVWRWKKEAISLHSSLSLGHLCFVLGELHFNTFKIHGADSLLWCFCLCGLLSVLWPFRGSLEEVYSTLVLRYTYYSLVNLAAVNVLA